MTSTYLFIMFVSALLLGTAMGLWLGSEIFRK
ncbi:membrane protein [Streptomyces phage Hippo]|nr:membrane protein [Streptomyces phage Hippo]